MNRLAIGSILYKVKYDNWTEKISIVPHKIIDLATNAQRKKFNIASPYCLKAKSQRGIIKLAYQEIKQQYSPNPHDALKKFTNTFKRLISETKDEISERKEQLKRYQEKLKDVQKVSIEIDKELKKPTTKELKKHAAQLCLS